MLHKIDYIKSCHNNWARFFKDNNTRATTCKNFVNGLQWAPSLEQMRGEIGEDCLVLNLLRKYLLRLKGDAEALDLSLSIKGKVSPTMAKEGQKVLERLILHNKNLNAFYEVLSQAYDNGYGVLQVSYRDCGQDKPYYEPFLIPVKNLNNVFFDQDAADEFKTEGRFCGITYKRQFCDLSPRYKNILKKHHYGDYEDQQLVVLYDFWYREVCEEEWFFYENLGDWSKEKLKDKILMTKQREQYKVKFLRYADDILVEEPVDYLTKNKLPLVFWPGLVEYKTDFDKGTIQQCTFPYAFDLQHIQTLINCFASNISGRLRKMGSSKIIATSDSLNQKQSDWNDFNSSVGTFYVNEDMDGKPKMPMIRDEPGLDPNLMNGLNIMLQIYNNLAGINAAQEGQQQNIATNAGLHRQIMQGNILQRVILGNHLRAINEVGLILKQMLPLLIFEQRFLDDKIVVNGKPISGSKLRNDIRDICSKIDFEIVYGANSEAEKAYNLTMLKDLLSTSPNLAPWLIDEFVANLNTSNKDILLRRMEALMPPGIKEVGDGAMSIEEYRAQQQQQQQQQPPSIEQQKLELDKQKAANDSQVKQAELQLKEAKLRNQSLKDAKNLNIKEFSAIAKTQPKEMIYEKEAKSNADG